MKKDTIFTLLLISALLIAGAFAFTGCGSNDAESTSGEEPTAASSEEPAPADEVSEGEWKSAYREILEANEDGIRNYEDPEELGDTFGGRKSAALCDLDEDGTPELLFMELDEYLDVLHIYSYKDGEASELTYPWTPSVAYEDDATNYDRLSAAQVAGGSQFVIYKEKNIKGFTAYSTITDATLEAATNRYEFGDDGKVERISQIGMMFSYMDEDGTGEYGPEHATYYDAYKEITGDEYEKTMTESVNNMDTVLFRFELIGEDVDADTYEQDNNPELWKKSKGKEICITYDEMLQQLPAGENEEEAKAGNAVSEDGKNMEALLKAYGESDFETAEEINGKLPETVKEMDVPEEEAEAYQALYHNTAEKTPAS